MREFAVNIMGNAELQRAIPYEGKVAADSAAPRGGRPSRCYITWTPMRGERIFQGMPEKELTWP